MSTPYLNRRHFLAALAASVVAAGVVLPIGFPKEVVKPNIIAAKKWVRFVVRFADGASEVKAREEMPWLFVHRGEADSNFTVRVTARQAA